MAEWKKGKPEVDYCVVWAWAGDEVFMAYVDYSGKWFTNRDCRVYANVTHWQELEIPEPPKERS